LRRQDSGRSQWASGSESLTLKLARGITSAILNFVTIGIVIPFALDYVSPLLSAYITLPSSAERWEIFIVFGALFAFTAFCRNGYSKGDYPWLVGKIGGGLVDIGLFYYLFQLMPSSLGSAAGIESSGLIYLAGLAVVCSYGYTIFDFIEARRTNIAKRDGAIPSGPPKTPESAN